MPTCGLRAPSHHHDHLNVYLSPATTTRPGSLTTHTTGTLWENPGWQLPYRWGIGYLSRDIQAWLPEEEIPIIGELGVF